MENENISISDAAAAEIKKLLINSALQNVYFRIGLKGSGCSGFKYFMSCDNSELKDKDLKFNSNGVDFIIDNKSLIYLKGSVIDWKKSLLRQGFDVINPNAKNSCGCGHSVSF